MRIVVVESPYRAESEFDLMRNLAYARALGEYFTDLGDCPLMSHLSITQWWDDRDPIKRAKGIAIGLAPLQFARVHAFGIDLGISSGMRDAMKIAKAAVNGPKYEEITLPEWKEAMAAPSSGEIAYLVERYAPKWHVHEKR